jgi:hypothetical protein
VETPTNAEIRARSALLNRSYTTEPEGEAELALVVLVAGQMVSGITARKIGPPTESIGEEVGPWEAEVAKKAIAMKAEQVFEATASAKASKIRIGGAPQSAMAAGSYNESKFSPQALIEGKVLDLDPMLHNLLWTLCTPEKQAYWLTIWDPAHFGPEGSVEAFDYGARPNYMGDRISEFGFGWPFWPWWP